MNTDFIDPGIFMRFINMTLFTDLYNRFLGLFPPATHWLVSAIVLVSIIAAFFVLIKTDWLWLLLLIVLIPVIFPILRSFFFGIYEFVLYLWRIVLSGVPRT